LPEAILVPAMSAGRAEKTLVLRGMAVNADTIIRVLSYPQLQRETLNAEYS
jgi:hypothetical protein